MQKNLKNFDSTIPLEKYWKPKETIMDISHIKVSLVRLCITSKYLTNYISMFCTTNFRLFLKSVVQESFRIFELFLVVVSWPKIILTKIWRHNLPFHSHDLKSEIVEFYWVYITCLSAKDKIKRKYLKVSLNFIKANIAESRTGKIF
jgi:hypothetical protein